MRVDFQLFLVECYIGMKLPIMLILSVKEKSVFG